MMSSATMWWNNTDYVIFWYCISVTTVARWYHHHPDDIPTDVFQWHKAHRRPLKLIDEKSGKCNVALILYYWKVKQQKYEHIKDMYPRVWMQFGNIYFRLSNICEKHLCTPIYGDMFKMMLYHIHALIWRKTYQWRNDMVYIEGC